MYYLRFNPYDPSCTYPSPLNSFNLLDPPLAISSHSQITHLLTHPQDSFIGDAYSTPAEVCLAIICACFPTVRPLFRHIITATQSRFGNSSYSLASTHRLKQRGDHIELNSGVSMNRSAASVERGGACGGEEPRVLDDGWKGAV